MKLVSCNTINFANKPLQTSPCQGRLQGFSPDKGGLRGVGLWICRVLARPYIWAYTLILALILLSGCASDSSPEWADLKGEAGPAPLVEFAPTAKITVRWHSKLGDTGLNVLQPALSGDRKSVV